MWLLGWVPYAVTHLTDPFFAHQLNAPDGVNLMWTPTSLFTGVLVAPVTVIAGPILAYNVAIVAGLATGALAAFAALRRYSRGRLGPLVGGAVYGFSPFTVSHAALHLDLAVMWFPPVVLILLHEIVARRDRPPWQLGGILGLVVVLQILTTEETVATTAIGAAILVAILVAIQPSSVRGLAGRFATTTAVAAVTATILAAWPLAVQFLGPQRVSARLVDADVFSTDLLNLVLPTKYQLIAPDAATRISDQFSGLFHEANAYIGLPLLVLLVAVAARRWDDLRIRAATIFGATIFVLSLGPHLHIGGTSTGWPMPWSIVSSLPLLESLVPSRFTVLLWLAIAVVVTIVIDEAVRRPRRAAAGRLAAVGLCLVVVLPAPLTSSSTDIPPFFANWDREGMSSTATVMIAPFFRDGAGADPMLWAAIARDEPRMPEAYAFVPQPDGSAAYGPAATQLTDIMETIQDRGVTVVARGPVRRQVGVDLAAKGITDVIVGPMVNEGAMVGFFTDLFGRPPEPVDGVEIWRDVAHTGVAPIP